MTTAQDKINITDARNDDYLKEKFFEQNIKLVYSVAFNKLKNVPLDKAEKLSLGNFGLVKAFNTYDANCGYAFSTYAMRCIANEILMENRKSVNKIGKKPLSLDGKVSEDNDSNELLLIDILSKEEEDFDKYDYENVRNVYKKFEEVYSEIDPKLLQIFNMYIFESKTTTEIGKIVGHTQAHTSRLATKAIKAIQEIAIEMDVINSFNRYARRPTKENAKKEKEKDNPMKRKALYVILNYPELDSAEIGKILNWNSMKIGWLKQSYSRGTFTLSPDDSIKSKVEDYLTNKKIYS